MAALDEQYLPGELDDLRRMWKRQDMDRFCELVPVKPRKLLPKPKYPDDGKRFYGPHDPVKLFTKTPVKNPMGKKPGFWSKTQTEILETEFKNE